MESGNCERCGKPLRDGHACEAPEHETVIRNFPSGKEDPRSGQDPESFNALFGSHEDSMIFDAFPTRRKPAPPETPPDEMTSAIFSEDEPDATPEKEATGSTKTATSAKKSIASTRTAPTLPVPQPRRRKRSVPLSQKFYTFALALLCLLAAAEIVLIALTFFHNRFWEMP